MAVPNCRPKCAARAGQMLGDIWNTAWLEASEDKYLEHQLELRRTQDSLEKKK
jgi:hypothetical protein